MKLMRYIKEYKFSAIAGFMFKIFEAVLELCVPLVMASIIDQGIQYHDTNYIIKCGFVLIALADLILSNISFPFAPSSAKDLHVIIPVPS